MKNKLFFLISFFSVIGASDFQIGASELERPLLEIYKKDLPDGAVPDCEVQISVTLFKTAFFSVIRTKTGTFSWFLPPKANAYDFTPLPELNKSDSDEEFARKLKEFAQSILDAETNSNLDS